MLLDCLASCTRCLSPRWERRAADKGEGAPAIPVPVPMEAAPEAAPAAPEVPDSDHANGPVQPFQIDLGLSNNKGNFKPIHATVDHSHPVNVVTKKCLKGLGWEPLKHGLPSELSRLAAEALLAPCGWQRLGLQNLGGFDGLTRHVQFVVVDDDYHCDLLLGREFKGVKLEPRPGMYPIFKNPNNQETRERQERQEREDLAREEAAAAERRRQSDERLEQLRKKAPKSGGAAGEGASA